MHKYAAILLVSLLASACTPLNVPVVSQHYRGVARNSEPTTTADTVEAGLILNLAPSSEGILFEGEKYWATVGCVSLNDPSFARRQAELEASGTFVKNVVLLAKSPSRLTKVIYHGTTGYRSTSGSASTSLTYQGGMPRLVNFPRNDEPTCVSFVVEKRMVSLDYARRYGVLQ